MKNILIVSLSPSWVGIARLPKALKKTGFNVITISRENSFLAKSAFIDFNYTYSNGWSLPSKINNILTHHQIDFIIPGCDGAVNYFSKICKNQGWKLFRMNRLKKLIVESCNNINVFEVLGNKARLQELAVRHSVPNPNNKYYLSDFEMLEDLGNRTFPVVMKNNFGAAGLEVKICNNVKEAHNALKVLSGSINTGLKKKLGTYIKRLLALPYDNDLATGISIQDYIEGTPCMHLVFASKGEVLSSVTLLKVCCYPDKTSPSSVVKPIRHKQISEDSAKLIRECKVTGFFSFDYIINDEDKAFILECNTRPTPITHLSHLCGGNLCMMLKKHLVDIETTPEPYPEIVHEYLALYPSEYKRDRNSEFLNKGFHDIPVDEEALLEKIKIAFNLNNFENLKDQ